MAHAEIKVWIFKGEILEHDPMAQDKKMAEQDHGGGGGGGDRDRDRDRGRRRDPRRGLNLCSIGRLDNVATEEDAIQKGLQGPHPRCSKGGFELNFGQFGLKAMEPERITARQIEGGPPRHDAPYEARRPRLDPHLPGCAGVEKAGRSPHG